MAWLKQHDMIVNLDHVKKIELNGLYIGFYFPEGEVAFFSYDSHECAQIYYEKLFNLLDVR